MQRVLLIGNPDWDMAREYLKRAGKTLYHSEGPRLVWSVMCTIDNHLHDTRMPAQRSPVYPVCTVRLHLIAP
jgi:hypothetical protein